MNLEGVYELSLSQSHKIRDYIKNRGIEDNGELGYTLYKGRECITIPVFNSVKELIALEMRDLYDKQYYKTIKPGYKGYLIFGADKAIKNTDYVVVCEGVFDCLSLVQNEINSISTLRASFSENILNLLTLWEHIFIAFDNDSVGAEKTRKILSFYDENYPEHNISVIDYYSKDLNEALINGEINDIVSQIK